MGEMQREEAQSTPDHSPLLT